MQHDLNETISHLEHLINLTKRHIDIDNTNNIESYPYGSLTHNPTVIDVPKLLNVGTIVSNVKNSPYNSLAHNQTVIDLPTILNHCNDNINSSNYDNVKSSTNPH